MKLITRSELYELPAGSILSNGGEVYMEDMFVYHGRMVHEDTPTPTDDFRITTLSICLPPEISQPTAGTPWAKNYKQMRDGFEVDITPHATTRDGLYEEDALFWLWERSDLEKLQTCISTALGLHKSASIIPSTSNSVSLSDQNTIDACARPMKDILDIFLAIEDRVGERKWCVSIEQGLFVFWQTKSPILNVEIVNPHWMGMRNTMWELNQILSGEAFCINFDVFTIRGENDSHQLIILVPSQRRTITYSVDDAGNLFGGRISATTEEELSHVRQFKL